MSAKNRRGVRTVNLEDELLRTKNISTTHILIMVAYSAVQLVFLRIAIASVPAEELLTASTAAAWTNTNRM
jgi:hypothetical protein